MLKRLSILFLCLLFALLSNANQDFIAYRWGYRFCVTIPSWRNTDNVGERLKIEQLLLQLRKSEKEIIPNNKYVVINIGAYENFVINPLKPSKKDILISCETGSYRGYDMDKLRKGDIVIINITQDISVKACLQLINYGISHFEEIKKNQKMIMSLHPRIWGLEEIGNITFPNHSRSPYRLLNALPETGTESILNQNDTVAKRLIQQKCYLRSSKLDLHNDSVVDCYTQNDSCFIYKKDKDSTIIFSNKQLVGFSFDEGKNYIAFTNEKHFYHIAMPSRKISGPFTIPEPELFAVSKYGTLDDSLYTSDDTAFITIHARYANYEGVRFKFHLSSGTVSIDSSSLSGYTKRLMDEQQELIKQQLVVIKTAEAFAIRKYYVLVLVAFVVVLNLFLAFSKKL